MREHLFGLMMVLLPFVTFFYVLFYGYPSLFASIIIVAVLCLGFLREVLHGNI